MPPAPFATRPAAPEGLREGLGALGATLAQTLRVRGALFTLELREEAGRARRMLWLAAVAAAFLVAGLGALAILVAAAFWDTWRLPAIGLVVLAYGGAAFAAFSRLGAEARAASPFEASIAELRTDLDAFGPGR